MHEIDLILKLQLEGNHKEARRISDNIEKIGKDNFKDPAGNVTDDIWMRHCFNRGWFLIQDGDYQGGCKLLESGRFLDTYGARPLLTNAPIFNPNTHSIAGKSIIISLEGGYGDEIIHSRFASSFKKNGASKVYIACAPELQNIFARIEGVDKVILRNEAHTVVHDFWVPGFSAGWVAGHTFNNFPGDPYLKVDTENKKHWANIIKSDKIKVGIRWSGNPKFEHQQFRKFPKEFLLNLSKYDELQLYSLQRDNDVGELPSNIIDLQHHIISWDDTLAAIDNLDIVITSCTSVAHAAAAIGKETWIIVPILPYHTWAYGSPDSTTSPYYNCVKLYRQKVFKQWNETFQTLYSDLEKKFNIKHVDLPNADYIPKKLNLGCGNYKIKEYHNVDKSTRVDPDEVVDLEITPWPWKDNEFDHILAKDILEHLPDFISTIKEMYRISKDGAFWEIQIPHWRCDTALNDPTHKRLITIDMFSLFDKKSGLERAKQGNSDSQLWLDHDIDIEVVDFMFDYTSEWQEKIKNNQITPEQLSHDLNHLNNVALSVKILIEVHKTSV